MARQKTIMHLRQSSGGGGGADTVIMDWLELLDHERFNGCVAYLHRRDRTVAPILERLDERDIDHYTFPAGRVFDFGQLLRIKSLIRERNVGLLHCHDPKADVYGRLLRLLVPGLKLAVTLHAWHTHSWRSALYKRLDLLAVRGFDLVTAVAQDIADIAIRSGVRGVQAIPNGVNLGRWTLRSPLSGSERPFCVGFVARLSREKGVEDFVNVAQRVVSEVPDVRFCVAGEGPEGERMRSLVNSAGLTERFEFSGFLDEAAMRGLYGSLDVLLHPSHSEGTPMTLLEAAATGVPVVATLVGGVGDVFTDGETACLTRAGDVEGLARSVIGLARDSARAAAQSAAARSAIEHDYDMATRVRLLEGLYLKVLGAESVGEARS
ncbi:glycosyltransferase [Desulfovibrio ferrophilus]|uniref:Putative group 1 glycosyl transferase n=1 Tax=Desulfovibrio ferrophilus TaxID=241368 RepID=A0A2Z6B172_9BACT|nr:glycosyltransferase [Desulfovibrio ferrophilus]BBD09251.1 putative group 1 glycosyl transferase [Desulfovibrio ferrophilus]